MQDAELTWDKFEEQVYTIQRKDKKTNLGASLCLEKKEGKSAFLKKKCTY